MGSSKDYSNVAEWTSKDTGYHTGDMVRYKNNIFRAAYWAGKEPGVDPGWSLYDELYDQTSPNPTTTAKIIGYLPTWRTDLDFGNAVMYQNITHGIIAFLNFDENNFGELDQTSAKAVTGIVQQIVTTAHKSGTYISVAIGGAVDYGFLNLLTAVGTNASDARLDKAVQNVAQFVKDNALDGVDLDLECWWDKNGDASKDQGGRDKSKGPHPAGSALVAFAQKLKAALPGKLVSATLFATSWYGNAYDPKLADQVDWLSIMSYDLTGSWNQTPVGPHTALYKIRQQGQYKDEQQGPWPATARGPSNNSTPMDDNPIFSVEDSLWYWSNPFFVNWQGEGQKVARNKLVAGVPLYGYDFAYIKDKDPESGQTPPGYKVLRYKELVQQFPGASTAANANIKVSGNTPRPSFVSAPGTYPYAHNIYLETPDTAVAKLKFLNQLGLQGVIIWEMSNEVWDDGKSIVKALYQASGNPATRPALPPPSRRFDKYCFLCTHNAYKNYEDHWTGPNQSFNLYHQLEKGVRSLMLDIYYEEHSSADVFKIIGDPGVYVLGEVNEHGWIAGITYAVPAVRLRDALNQVGSWLDGTPNEVVTIFLEDYTQPDRLEAEIALVNKSYQDMMYNPANDSKWRVPDRKEWPLLSDLVAWNKRLVLFSDHNDTAHVAYDRNFTKQNYWSLGGLGTDWDCPSRWDGGQYQDADYPKLFLFNHYRDVPTVITAALDNTYEKIMDRIENRCQKLTNQLPNFVGVDFFELPLNDSKAGDVVTEINKRFANG
jgi:GH18 family chitinase